MIIHEFNYNQITYNIDLNYTINIDELSNTSISNTIST